MEGSIINYLCCLIYIYLYLSISRSLLGYGNYLYLYLVSLLAMLWMSQSPKPWRRSKCGKKSTLWEDWGHEGHVGAMLVPCWLWQTGRTPGRHQIFIMFHPTNVPQLVLTNVLVLISNLTSYWLHWFDDDRLLKKRTYVVSYHDISWHILVSLCSQSFWHFVAFVVLSSLISRGIQTFVAFLRPSRARRRQNTEGRFTKVRERTHGDT